MVKHEEEHITWLIDGYELLISHPQKLYWPKEGYTKIDVLNYYKTISKTILPYFKDRPATLHYFPRGINDFSFYKRNFKNENQLRTVLYKEVSQDKTIKVPLIDSSEELLWLASRGGIEFHLWSSKMPHYRYPDIAIFDLDISKDGDFNNVLKVGWYLHKLLDSMNLKAYPKTSGGTGLHIYVPLVAKYSFKQVRNWVKGIGDKLANSYPNLITTEKDKGATHKSKKVIVDCLQNVISRNTAAPYTIRAYSGAPVSTPLTWNEVKKGGFTPKTFSINTVTNRVEKLGDLFLGVLTDKQFLPLK